jgi:4'-phosphopantetheinyl transferase EntD
MERDFLDSSYKSALLLQRHDKQLTASLCVSRLPLDSLKVNTLDFLHVKEQTYFTSLQYPKRQYSYLLGRFCAKHAISNYLQNKSLSSTLIENGVFNQPIVYHPFPTDVEISISHTDSMGAALAFPNAHPMGIDLEMINEAHVTTIKSQLTLIEQQKAALFSENEPLVCTLLWTVKEALSKALKCGFMISFELFEIEEIKHKENYVESSFKHFQQFKALSFPLAETVCSLVYPKGTHLIFDIEALQKIMTRSSK